MVAAVALPLLTYAEYLEHEETAAERSEYLDGTTWAMSGGSQRHAAITMNIGATLHALLRGKPCRPTSSDQRIYVDAVHGAFYADVTVVCGRFAAADVDPQAITNPTVVVEVLSPTTAARDRSLKLDAYRRLPSLQACLFVSQDLPEVESWERVEGDTWLVRRLTEGAVALKALGIELPFADIYANLEDLPPPAASPSAGAAPTAPTAPTAEGPTQPE